MQVVVTFVVQAHMPLLGNYLAHLAPLVHFQHLQANLLVLEPTLVTQDRKQSQVHRHQQMDAQIVSQVLFKMPRAIFLLHAVRVV